MINNKELFLQGFWNWDFISDQLPGKIKVSDIDGIIEKNGHFLVIETKRPGVGVSQGQEIMFKKMASTGLFTILIIWGVQGEQSEVPKVESLKVISPTVYGEKRGCSASVIQKLIKKWYERVINL